VSRRSVAVATVKVAVAVVVAGIPMPVPMPDAGEPEPPTFGAGRTANGSRVGVAEGDVKTLADSYYRNVVAKPPFYDYSSVSPCGGAPGSPTASDAFCNRAVVLCQSNPPEAQGPAVAIYRREVNRRGAPVAGTGGQWAYHSITCLPQLVPGAGNVLTMAMVRNAFADTVFTKATVNIQPEGDLTLVNLPTYFEARFPEAGFGPDEVSSVSLLGYDVQIKPYVQAATYHLGETTVGPVNSLGGPYPTGDVIATY
jgi:hypothetical protein